MDVIKTGLLAFGVVCGSALVASPTKAVANETKIRQAGDDEVVRVPGQFTAQGSPSDVLVVVLNDGTIFAASTIRDFISSGFVNDFYRASNGELVIRVGVVNPEPRFNGGTVSIWRGSWLIDRDRIRFR